MRQEHRCVEGDATQVQATIAEKNTYAQDGLKHIDTVRAALDAALNEAQEGATQTESEHQASLKILENLREVVTSAREDKVRIAEIATAIADLRKAVEDDAATTKPLAEAASTTDNRIKAYEAELVRLQNEAAQRLATIDTLLPGATSAGLATAFETRSETFKPKEVLWQWVFVASIGGLLALAVGGTLVFRRAEGAWLAGGDHDGAASTPISCTPCMACHSRGKSK